MLLARDSIRGLKEYHPPLACREGLRLDFNENTVGCSPRVLEILRRFSGEELARYPERDPVEKEVADFLRVQRASLVLTNGVDESIHLLCETYLEPDHEVIVPVPTFSMYEIYASATGACVRSIPACDDFVFPTGGVLSAINERTRMIAIANPNNPTGGVAAREDLLKIAAAAPNAAVLVDEAYFEFYGETVIDAISELPNVFVARTFSKAYGLAGLRAGALVGPAEQMKMVRRVSSPYNVNAVALACLPASLADSSYIGRYVSEVRAGRERLQALLPELGIQYWPSRANFVLVRIGAESGRFVRAMRERGILVRDRSSDPGCDGCIRITIGSTAQTDRLLHVMRDVIAGVRIARLSV